MKKLSPLALSFLLVAILAAGVMLTLTWWWPISQNNNLAAVNGNLNGDINISDWQTYQNTELGFSFKYPADWKKIKLSKQKNFNNLAGTVYSSWTYDNGHVYFDPENAFSFSLYSKDFEPYEFPISNLKKVNVNWSVKEYAANMKVDNILLTKKLSNKSMLVGVYTDPECSPMMRLSVIAPFNESYHNFEISINIPGINEDPIIKNYAKQQTAKDGNDCDMLGGYQKIADKIAAGTYSDELDQRIEIAQDIADSLIINE